MLHVACVSCKYNFPKIIIIVEFPYFQLIGFILYFCGKFNTFSFVKQEMLLW